jgi:hypothetical protein
MHHPSKFQVNSLETQKCSCRYATSFFLTHGEPPHACAISSKWERRRRCYETSALWLGLGRRKRPRPRVGAATFRAAVGGRRRRARAGGRGALSLPCGRHRCGREVVALPAPGYATPAVANPAGQRRRTIHQALPVKSQAHRRCARGRTGRAGFDLRAILTSRPLAFRLLVGSSVYHHSD